MPDDECYEEIKQSKEREGESDQGKLLFKKEVSILTDERERALWGLEEEGPGRGGCKCDDFEGKTG